MTETFTNSILPQQTPLFGYRYRVEFYSEREKIWFTACWSEGADKIKTCIYNNYEDAAAFINSRCNSPYTAFKTYRIITEAVL
ncbi:MAG: hypothetical protein C5B59_06570 [Bacteroidetes bacterium]|nr:MAG: hypothetical protein C5B59_06570 [Bacteroidota bacterium]